MSGLGLARIGDTVEYKTKAAGRLPIKGIVIGYDTIPANLEEGVVKCLAVYNKPLHLITLIKITTKAIARPTAAEIPALIASCAQDYKWHLATYPVWAARFAADPTYNVFAGIAAS